MKLKENRKARFNYTIGDKYEAGIQLEGWEVKSIKAGNVSLDGSFAAIINDEMWLKGLNVSNWPGARSQSDTHRKRDRRLLLKKSELRRIDDELKRNRRSTLVPLKLFEVRRLVKVQLGMAIGKKKYEKKEAKKLKDLKRNIKNELR